MIEALEASALAEHLRQSRWTYPLVNAGHIAGIALLFGSVVPMSVEVLRRGADAGALRQRLRPYAIAGLVLAVTCGALLFIAQASEYLENRWFVAKLALITLALVNAAWHLRARTLQARPRWLRSFCGLPLWSQAG